MEQIKGLLVYKFEEIHRRILMLLEQLNDVEINWRPNDSSNSIVNLLVHISGNIKERVSHGINQQAWTRNRDEEFEPIFQTRNEAIERTNEAFTEIIETTKHLTEAMWMQTQWVRNKERTNLDILMQCAAHFSEHMGQMLYIGKIIKDKDYVSTSIPKK